MGHYGQTFGYATFKSEAHIFSIMATILVDRERLKYGKAATV